MPNLNLRIWCAKCNKLAPAVEVREDHHQAAVEITAVCHGSTEAHTYSREFLAHHARELSAQIGLAFENEATYGNA